VSKQRKVYDKEKAARKRGNPIAVAHTKARPKAGFHDNSGRQAKDIPRKRKHKGHDHGS
jgi:hypothetical protein